MRGASAIATTHGTTLTRNTQRHPGPSVIAPPRTQPSAPPPAAAAVHAASARVRLRPSVTVAVSSASAAGETAAAPSPCTARAATSAGALGASPQASDAAPNTANPAIITRRRPARSAARPSSMRKPPNVSP